MVADPLALNLAGRFVSTGDTVLDPFCGSGRLLAAAEKAALRVGIDTNPLACLLTQAKLVPARREVLRSVLAGLPSAKFVKPRRCLTAAVNGNVDWFSPAVLTDLEKAVTWLNEIRLDENELLVVAAALSATVRDVSFARQSGWKLHRIGSDERSKFSTSVWERLERRLRYCERELPVSVGEGTAHVVRQGDARTLSQTLRGEVGVDQFDVVLTSPPYGDSRTTVQYGAASALCLSVISRLKGLEHLWMKGSAIDGACLGSKLERDRCDADEESFRPYWAGSPRNPAFPRTAAFLRDYREVCRGIASALRAGGNAIFVVGRRSTGGFRLKLDMFTVNELASSGLRLVERDERALSQKRFPRIINRFGRSIDEVDRNRGQITTMRSEVVLVFQKSAN
jgi:SAM-dependent methyltransferase